MVELIVFPDVEALAVRALTAAFTASGSAVKGSTRIPSPRSDEFIRVLRIGGPKETLISENALLIVESWAQTEARAVTILSFARAVLNSQDGDIFGVTEVSGPNNLPDPTTSQVRYTQTFGVRVRGTVTAL